MIGKSKFRKTLAASIFSHLIDHRASSTLARPVDRTFRTASTSFEWWSAKLGGQVGSILIVMISCVSSACLKDQFKLVVKAIKSLSPILELFSARLEARL